MTTDGSSVHVTADVDLVARLRESIPITNGIGDMWPVFRDGELFRRIIDALAAPFLDSGVTKVAGVEARGFVLGSAVANRLGAGFVGIRKPGGLYPGPTYERRTPPDYRGNEFVLRLQREALGPSDRMVVIDDWFETGGQASAAVDLIQESGAEYLGASIVVDWLTTDMRKHLGPVYSIVDRETLPG